MAISLLNEVRLNDLLARSPALFSTLPFVAYGQPSDPASALGRDVSPSEATKPVELQSRSITPEELTNQSGSATLAQNTEIRARPALHDLLGQNIPSDHSITVIAGLTERDTTPSNPIALYERTAQPVPDVHAATLA